MRIKPNSEREIINFNETAHDKYFDKYEKEQENNIFNLEEQNRLYKYLDYAVKNITRTSDQDALLALDYGCGTGNLTNHLISLHMDVTAADISDKFLQLIEQKFSKTDSCRTVKLNEKGLKVFKDNSFDLIACYSVLHHIPDYLQEIQEMTRIVKPGGIIYLDHEVNDSYWNPTGQYLQFIELIKPYNIKQKKWYRWFQLSHYIKEILNKLRRTGIFRNTAITNPLNPRFQPFGDIHVWPDDHIEWNKIEKLLKHYSFSVLIKDDYLLYKANYPRHIYNQYKNKCSDHRVLISKKL